MKNRLLFGAIVVGVSSGLLMFCVGDDQSNQDASTDAQTDITTVRLPDSGASLSSPNVIFERIFSAAL